MEKKDDLTFDFMTNREILQIAEPKDDLEKLILEKAMKELGEVTTVPHQPATRRRGDRSDYFG